MSLNQDYTDPGATAADDIDGDLTDEITADLSAIDNTSLGDYPLIYSVTDHSDNTATATRTVSVVAVEIDDDGEDNDGDGEVDEDNTVDENGPPVYEDLDPTDPSLHDEVIKWVKGWKRGKIRVKYQNDSVYRYTVYIKNKKVRKKKTKVRHYRSTGYYGVLQAHGKKLALTNVFNGETLKRKKITKNKKKKFKYNNLKIFKLRKKYWGVVTSKKKNGKVRLAVVRIKINKEKFGRKTVKTLTKRKVSVKKTKRKKKHRIFLRNKKGKVLKKFRLSKNKKKLKLIKK